MNDSKNCTEEETLLPEQTKEGEVYDQPGNRDSRDLLRDDEKQNDPSVREDQDGAEESRGEDPGNDLAPCGDDPQVLEVSHPAGEDPDPRPEKDERARILELREELNELEARIAAREATYKKLERECAEFRELYPGVPLESLSDKVWEDVQNGVPVAAAFALAERRRILLEEKAQKSNAHNKKNAPGSVSGSEENFFSPAEVRAMTREQVRENYEKIMLSMQKWN